MVATLTETRGACRMDIAMLNTAADEPPDASARASEPQPAAPQAEAGAEVRAACSMDAVAQPAPPTAELRSADAPAAHSPPPQQPGSPEVEGPPPSGPLREALESGDYEWLGMPGGQRPTITWPLPAPDGRPRAPIVSWASPPASAPSPFASAASVPFDELVAGSRGQLAAGEPASPPEAPPGTSRQPPVWDSPSSDVPAAGETDAAAGADQSGGDSAAASPQAQRPAEPPPLGSDVRSSSEAASDMQEQKLAAWQATSGGKDRLRANSNNSKMGMASSDSVSSWQCPPGALGSLGPTPTASPHYTPPHSPPGSLPVSPRLATLAEHPGSPFDGAPSAEPAEAAALLRLHDNAGHAAGNGGSGSARRAAEERSPGFDGPADAGSGPGGSSADASGSPREAGQPFPQSHAAPASACCHDETLGAAPNPFAAAAHSSSFSGGPGASGAPRPAPPNPFASTASRQEPPNPFSSLDAWPQPSVPPPNPFATTAAGRAVAIPQPVLGLGPNPFDRDSANSAAEEGPNPFARDSASSAADGEPAWPSYLEDWPAVRPVNPFEAEGGWVWPPPPPSESSSPPPEGFAQAEGQGALLQSSGWGELWNTDRDIMLPHSLIIKALNTGVHLSWLVRDIWLRRQCLLTSETAACLRAVSAVALQAG